MRALGIDFGTVRIGVAVSDEKMKLASALTTIEYSNNNYQYVIDKLRLIIKRYEIDLIVLGYPILKDGTKREITLLVESFYEKLKKAFQNIRVVLYDESNSTKDTISNLKEVAQLKGSQIKKVKDKLAAQKILQNYLERK